MKKKFGRMLRMFRSKTEKRIEKTFRGAVLDLGSVIILSSPVDTGRFRLNWNFTVDYIDPSTNKEAAASKSASANIAIGKLKSSIKFFDMGTTFYMTNNLPYAIPLEYGHSQQAPSGMVRLGVKQFNEILKDRLSSTK